VRSNIAYAAGNQHAGNVGQRSNANSRMGSDRPANSAMANSDMQDQTGMASDNSYAEL